ncbi:MAG TPA: class I SAM-dependent methyltransferase [Gammaproteobacteria bacterium]|jgi:predicted O-methyltransferase YrrM
MKLVKRVVDLLNVFIALLVAPIAYVQVRLGPERMPLTYRIWDAVGLTPLRHHYYQPVFNVNTIPEDVWTKKDPMLGIDWDEEGQLALLSQFNYQNELERVPVNEVKGSLEFYHDNNSFGSADAEMLYNMVRFHKPGRVIEIGSGYSTRMMKKALDENKKEGFQSSHICIEPYEMPWLESLGLDEVVREKVESVNPELFSSLQENDILFIDSSHVLRLGGDVFAEYLRILPSLNPGVVVHIHDIFLPYEYPRSWVVEHRRFWTEQYILQAFLAFNSSFRVLAAVHWLYRDRSEQLASACPVYAKLNKGGGSFWMKKIK